jgi:hypothetical protein
MLNENEKLFLKEIVKKTLKDFEEDSEKITTQIPFNFFKTSVEYEDFLKGLLKKLEKNG